jgi:hypothetical protein
LWASTTGARTCCSRSWRPLGALLELLDPAQQDHSSGASVVELRLRRVVRPRLGPAVQVTVGWGFPSSGCSGRSEVVKDQAGLGFLDRVNPQPPVTEALLEDVLCILGDASWHAD